MNPSDPDRAYLPDPCGQAGEQMESDAADFQALREILDRLIAAVEFEVPPIQDDVDRVRRAGILWECARAAREEADALQNGTPPPEPPPSPGPVLMYDTPLRGALLMHDSQLPACPVRRRRVSPADLEKCSLCGATSRDDCGVAARAALKFVDEIRLILDVRDDC